MVTGLVPGTRSAQSHSRLTLNAARPRKTPSRRSCGAVGMASSSRDSAPIAWNAERMAISPATDHIDHPSGVGMPGTDSPTLVVVQVVSGWLGPCKAGGEADRLAHTVSGRDCSNQI